jgi:hypothetical protein
MAVAEETPEREDRRAKYRAVVDYELAMTQARFQTLAIFLAAVGFVVGSGHFSQALGAVLVFITLGLWVVDLRSRDSLRKWRASGAALEKRLLATEDQQFEERTGREEEVRFGLFSTPLTITGWAAGLVSFQFGIDVIFSGVIGFGVALLADQSGWTGACMVAGFVLVPAAVATYWGWLHRKEPDTPADRSD